MSFKKFLYHKHDNLGVYFSESGVVAFDLCQIKNGYVSGTFHRLMKNARAPKNLKTKMAHASMPDLKVMYKTISMSSELMREDMLADLQLNQENYFPHIMDDLVFDVILPSIKLAQQTTQTINVFAVRKSDVDTRIQQAKQNGLLLSSLEPESYSLLRIVSFYKKMIHSEKNYVVCFCFQTQCRVIVLSHGCVRDIQKKAINHDFFGDLGLQFMSRMLRDPLIESAMVNVEGCYLVHADTISNNFIQALSKELQCEVELINPFQKIQCEFLSDVELSDAMIALGSALRGIHV